jgi:hypothetical protein
MPSIDIYRANAEACMRRAANDAAESGGPLWAMLARSWLQLAEHAGRIGDMTDAEAAEEAHESTEEAPAQN